MLTRPNPDMDPERQQAAEAIEIKLYLHPASMTIPGVGLVYIDPPTTAGSGYDIFVTYEKVKKNNNGDLFNPHLIYLVILIASFLAAKQFAQQTANAIVLTRVLI